MDDEHKKLLERISNQLEQLQYTAELINKVLWEINVGPNRDFSNPIHSYLKAMYEIKRDKK